MKRTQRIPGAFDILGRTESPDSNSFSKKRKTFSNHGRRFWKNPLGISSVRTANELSTVLSLPEPKDWTLDWAGRKTEGNASLTFSPNAWAKIQYFRENENEVEVSGFGISHPDNLLKIVDFALIKQKSQAASTKMDDDDIGEYIENCLEEGIPPKQCMRVWIHTHPGMSPSPSRQDEKTFAESFEQYDWMVMCITSNENLSYARLRITKPLPITIDLPVKVDYSIPLEVIDYEELANLYKEKVSPFSYVSQKVGPRRSWMSSYDFEDSDFDDSFYSTCSTGSYGVPSYDGIIGKDDDEEDSREEEITEEKEILLQESKTNFEKPQTKTARYSKCGICKHSSLVSLLDDHGICPRCKETIRKLYSGK